MFDAPGRRSGWLSGLVTGGGIAYLRGDVPAVSPHQPRTRVGRPSRVVRRLPSLAEPAAAALVGGKPTRWPRWGVSPSRRRGGPGEHRIEHVGDRDTDRSVRLHRSPHPLLAPGHVRDPHRHLHAVVLEVAGRVRPADVALLIAADL